MMLFSRAEFNKSVKSFLDLRAEENTLASLSNQDLFCGPLGSSSIMGCQYLQIFIHKVAENSGWQVFLFPEVPFFQPPHRLHGQNQ